MLFVNTRTNYKADFLKYLHQTKNFFSSNKGKDILVHSVLYTTQVGVSGTHDFEIREEGYVGNVVTQRWVDGVTKFFSQEGFEKELTSLRKKLTKFNVTDENSPIFYTYPQRKDLAQLLNNSSNLSPPDKITAKFRPVGLIEYCVLPKVNGTVDLFSIISLTYKQYSTRVMHAGISLGANLLNKGTYRTIEKKVATTGSVNTIGKINQAEVQKYMKRQDHLSQYVLKYATQVEKEQ